MARKPKHIPLPHLPWLAAFEQADCERVSITAPQAREIARFVNTLREEARTMVNRLVVVGNATDWKDGGQTDRVFYWDELEPLRKALLGDDSPDPSEE